MKKHIASNRVVNIIIIVLALSSLQVLGHKHRKEMKITLLNDLGEDLKLAVHCYSDKHDLGIKFTPYGDRFQWFAEDEYYICEMDWSEKSEGFLIYDSDRDDQRCNPGWCFWRVNQDGLYLSLHNPDRFELQFKWN